jgi:nucleoside-diphosphate-sugar epimerase
VGKGDGTPRGAPAMSRRRTPARAPSVGAGAVLFITGATGFVGGRVLRHLLGMRPHLRAVALVRRREQAEMLPADPRVTAVVGDLTRADLGLDAACRRRLGRTVTEMLHCAAVTSFGLPIDAARAVNTEGTRAVLALARRLPKLDRLGHVSTVYVAGRTAGVLGEAPARHTAAGFCNAYQQSKREAEELVLDAMSDVPAAIYRLSSIVGDSRTGRVDQWNHVHQLMRLFPRNVLPIAPGDPGAPVDLIPSDWAIPALAHRFAARFAAGSIAQICAGASASLSVRELVDLTARAYRRHPRRREWPDIRVPQLVTLDEFEAYVERNRRAGDRLFAELLRVLGLFLPHLAIPQAFDNRVAMEGLAERGIELPPIRGYYERIVEYGIDTAWGKARPVDRPARAS